MTKNCVTCGKPFGRELGNFHKRKACSQRCAWDTQKKDMVSCFWAKVDKLDPSGCWVWTASCKEKGYGQFFWRGKMNRAHRLAWTLLKGDPGRLEVAHTCDNRKCVNPDHLFLATHAENMKDCLHKDRQASKLKAKHIPEIRARLKAGERAEDIAPDYGVAATAIFDIRRGDTWRHIP